MKQFEVDEIMREEKIPRSKGRKDYTKKCEKLFEAWHRISAGSSLKVEKLKKSDIQAIRNNFNKKFGKSAVRVTQRQRDDGMLDCYIIRKK